MNAVTRLSELTQLLLLQSLQQSILWTGNVHPYIMICATVMTKQNKVGQFNPLSYPQRVFLITDNKQPLH